MSHVHDLIGIGFGPNNIGLAVHLGERSAALDALFLEARPDFDWHPGMLLDTADIQHAAVRDFVAPIEPRSQYTFMNYLKVHDRLLEHFNTPAPFPLRKELAGYVQWVAGHFRHQVRFDARVADVRVLPVDGEHVFAVTLGDGSQCYARSLSLGTGRTPRIPAVFEPHLGPHVFHLGEYRERIDRLTGVFGDLRVAVVGASQSAVEILLDLHRRTNVRAIHGVMRSYAFRQKDLSPFTERLFFPEFVRWFQGLDESARTAVNAELGDAIYARADKDALDALYRAWYEDRIDGAARLTWHPYCETRALERDADGLGLVLSQRYTGRRSRLSVDAVVLATGFHRLGAGEDDEKLPPLLAGIADRIEREPSGCVRIQPDYRVDVATDNGGTLPLYLNGFAEPSHSLGDAGSFPLLAFRADRIVWSLVARQHGDALRVSA